MDKLALAMLERGDIAGLLAEKKSLFGDATMTGPAGDPTGQTVTLPPAPPAPAPTPAPNVQTFTAEDIERARQQEKDKLYETVEAERQRVAALEQQMAAFSTDLATRQQAEEEARAAALAAEEEKRLAELSFAERLAETEQKMTGQLSELQQQLQQRDAVLEMERRFNELKNYINARLNSTDENDPATMILPQLRELVTGNTKEEVDASISALSERSMSILQEVATATQDARQLAGMQSRGVGVTAPPVGPMDTNSGHETVTADDIRNMDMQTYAANRGRLLGAASQQQQGRGMFG